MTAATVKSRASDADKVKLIFFSRDGFIDKLAADLAAGSKEFDANLLAT
jgi:multiple sugar transport system substrate-binding protein